MALGTLFVTGSTRCILLKALVKKFNLDIEVAERDGDERYAKNFPLKKVPAYLGSDGLVLHEAIAIVIYFISLVENNNLLGDTKEDYAQVLKYLSLFNMEVLPALAKGFRGIIGLEPYNKKISDAGIAEANENLAVIEARLTNNTYLVGERISAADLYSACLLLRGFKILYGKEWRAEHPAIVRWWITVTNGSILKPFFADFEFIDEPVKFTPPKKEPKAEKPKAEKKAEKPKAAAADEEEDDTPKEKKAPHPLAALGNAKLAIDNWKRVYSNEDTRAKALPWFWENYDAEEWSLWKVAYKYNDELTLTFMSNNLIGGFFNRLTASTKYLFGTAVVYGENNNNGIIGAFLVRGQDFKPAFEVAPDWESYDYTKLDASNEDDKALVGDLWAWDKPIEIAGEKKEIVDGKVFK